MNQFTLTRRSVLGCLGALGTGTVSPVLMAQSALEMATVVVGLAAGGSTDMAARRIADGLRGSYARTVVVDNRTGAGARLAVQFVKAAAPNGATLLLSPSSMLAIYPHTYKNLAYDPLRDIVPVGITAIADLGFAVGPAVPTSVKTVPEFFVWVKGNPTKATFGSGATGSGPHFLGELLARIAGVNMTHAGYRGSQPAILELLGGHIPAVSAPLGEFLPHMKGGQLRVLAVSGANRSRFMPDVSTFKELGIALSELSEWFGVFMPAGTSADIILRASTALKATVAKPEFSNALGLMGLEATWSTPQDLVARLRADHQRWRGIIEQIGFTAES